METIWSAEIVLRDSGSEAGFPGILESDLPMLRSCDLRKSLKFLPDSLNGPPRRWRTGTLVKVMHFYIGVRSAVSISTQCSRPVISVFPRAQNAAASPSRSRLNRLTCPRDLEAMGLRYHFHSGSDLFVTEDTPTSGKATSTGIIPPVRRRMVP